MQAPLALVPVRLAWLTLLALIACHRAGRTSPPAWLGVAEQVLEEGFLYVVFLLLAAPCIVRLVSDRPESVATVDDRGFWAATIAGCVFAALEGYITVGALSAVRSWAKRRLEAREATTNGMDVELLAAASAENGSGAGASGSTSPGGRSGRGSGAEEGSESKNNAKAVKELFRLVTAEWPLLIQASVLLALAAISEVLSPHYIGETISEIIKAEEEGTLALRPYKTPVIKLLISAACCSIFSSCRGATFLIIGGRASVRLRQSLFDTLMRQEIGFFDTTKTGELTSRMTQDCQKVTDQVTLNVNVFLRTMVSTITTLIFMYTLSGALTMVAFISVPAIVVISKQYGKVMRKLSEATQKALADANAVAEEGLSTMSTVRSFAAEGLESQRFGAKLADYGKMVRRQARFYIIYLASTMMLPQAVTGLVLFYGGKLALEQRIRAGSLLSFVFYLQTLNSNFSTLGDFYSSMVQALGAAQRVFDLRAREPKLPLDPPVGLAAPTGDYEGTLRLEGVRFKYPARPDIEVLKGLSLEVPAGKVVALVGPSGNGKSTVIGLLKRLYKADEGSVTIDGVDVWRFQHGLFHRLVSIVGQEPVLYARSIRENVVCGLENPAGLPQSGGEAVDDERVFDAAKKANAHDFILEMPEGYATEVGERGVQLSGGQKQRIAIARALVRQPKVLLLDEATSALDADSERQVQQAIDSMIEDGCMTVVIIAHRLSTVKNSHKICVVQGGQVVEEGPHEELISKGGAYFRLVQCQLSSHPAAVQSNKVEASGGGGEAEDKGEGGD